MIIRDMFLAAGLMNGRFFHNRLLSVMQSGAGRGYDKFRPVI
jgi:hypothetical protein